MTASTLSGQDERTRAVLFWLLLVTALGALLRVLLLGDKDLSLDEAFTWIWSQKSHGSLWGAAAVLETNPPLFYSIEKLASHVFGDSEAGLRAFSVVVGTLTIPMVFLVGRLIGGTATGLLAALLLAVSPLHVGYSQEARAYALLALVATISVWGLLVFLRSYGGFKAAPVAADSRGRRLGLAAYAAATSVALYCHNTAVLLPFFANVVAVCWWAGRARFDRRFALEWLGANLVPLALWLWWVPVVVQQMQSADNFSWVTQPDLFSALAQTARIYGLVEWYWIGPIPLLAVVALWRLRDRWPAAAAVLVFVAGVPVATWLVGELARPIWIERVLLWPVAFGVVLFAAGALAVRPVALRAGVIAVVLAVLSVGLVKEYRKVEKAPYHLVTAAIAAEIQADDVILHSPPFNIWPYVYYAEPLGLPERNIGIYDGDGPLAAEDLVVASMGDEMQYASANELRYLSAKYRRAWALFRNPAGGDLRARDTVLASLRQLGNVIWQRSYPPNLELYLVSFSSSGGEAEDAVKVSKEPSGASSTAPPL